ncbi:GTPase Era [Pelotomaculum terephthalicicum JT]|uniref:GTPase Era n=1 Tax=Pelotomaculum TaxID=191373 RepID=UPI0009D309AD|nr:MULTISPECIES: GTPase Era [Pelotomaculum]MCG9967054.1 GTPase Era [Pelotomaculum terephthalicicum JT]OPX90499.1 MAG: GTPase Era [Pelotomaculum sp. PtaB.Bin117]OPY63901.1 MAG: GTPase Era [Pelotomaculum sp. PtaU1.Bin065]
MVEENDNFRSGFAALVGRTNVGKSTLLNRLIGRKVTIMSEKVQTTRNRILGVLTREECQVIFLDTPGIHKPKHKLGEHLVQVALNTLNEVDLVLFLVEANRQPGPGDNYLIRQFADLSTPVALVINKIDLVKRKELLPLIERYARLYKFSEIIPVSALSGENTGRLLEVTTSYLPAGPKYYPDEMVTDRPEEFILAELIREKVLSHTEQEVPHAVAVVIEEMQERPNNVMAVRAVIYTERETQKGILIGKGGQMLKKIGSLARADMEKLLGLKVFLQIRVKTRPDWRNKEAQLKNLGYYET